MEHVWRLRKRESIDPLTGKEQARAYAESLGVSHIFLSNGLVHYYWNLQQGNPVRMSRFLSLDEFGKAAEWKPDSARLAAEAVDEGSRFLLQEGKFADLRARDASLFNSLSQLESQEREALIGYLQSQVPLKEFELVA